MFRWHLTIPVHLHYDVAMYLERMFVAEDRRASYALVHLWRENGHPRIAGRLRRLRRVVVAAVVYHDGVIHKLGKRFDHVSDVCSFVVTWNHNSYEAIFVHCYLSKVRPTGQPKRGAEKITHSRQ